MLTVSAQPGGDMTQEEFAAKTRLYTVYYSGSITLSGTEQTGELSDADYRSVYEFADALCNHRLSSSADNQGADMPSYYVSAYDPEGNSTDLTVSSRQWVQEFDEIYPVLKGYF